MAEQNIRIILKNGTEFVMACEIVSCRHDRITGELTSINYKGATKNIPIYLDLSQVAAVLQEEIKTENTP